MTERSDRIRPVRPTYYSPGQGVLAAAQGKIPCEPLIFARFFAIVGVATECGDFFGRRACTPVKQH